MPGIGAMRGVPDVAGDASNTLTWRSCSPRPAAPTRSSSEGGTSATGPFWAGLIALADQDAGHPLGFVNPAIYRIARGPQYHKAFHDITTGNNTVVLNGVTITGYQAGPGWDPVTGWGPPTPRSSFPCSPAEAPRNVRQLRAGRTPPRNRSRARSVLADRGGSDDGVDGAGCGVVDVPADPDVGG